MDLHLTGKSVIVTASSKGLGKATALEFAKEGAVVMISSRNESELEKVVAEIKEESSNDKVNYAVCDVTKPDDVKNLIENTVELHGKIDILINNSGGPPAGGFEEFSDEDWQNAFELNLLSYIRLVRGVIPHMRKVGEGRIINIASSSIKQTLDNLILSNTLRAGVLGLSKGLSQELAKDNILINTIGPGRIATDRVVELDEIRAEKEDVSYKDLLEETEKSIPIGRYGRPEEFAKVVVFLSSSANTYVTGQSLIVDGGLIKAL